MREAPALPQPAQFGQRVLVRAAVDLLPPEIRGILELGPRYGLRPFEREVITTLAARAESVCLPSSPPSQACVRLGLPADYLHRS